MKYTKYSIDLAVRNCSAFGGFNDLKRSMDEHGYVPTLTVDEDANRNTSVRFLRAYLVSERYEVFPKVLEEDERKVIQAKVSPTGIGMFEDAVGLFEGDWEEADREAMVVGKTFIRCTRRLMEAGASAVAASEDDWAEMYQGGGMCETQAQCDFAEKSARRAVEAATNHLFDAVLMGVEKKG